MSSDDTRGRILATASTHFASYGFEGASLRKIAEDAGIRAASIFHHFPGGKAALFEAICKDIGHSVGVRIIQRYGLDAGLSPVEAIVQMVATFWDYCANHTDYAKLILLRATDMEDDFAMLEADLRGIVSAARAFIENAQARGELAQFDIEHFMLWSCVHPLTVFAAPALPAFFFRPDEIGRLRGCYIAMVRDYVRPRDKTTRAPRTFTLKATNRAPATTRAKTRKR
jgi:AcrR family transcriptional regulator